MIITDKTAPVTEHPSLDVDAIRRDFPILATQVNGHTLVYLDSAATSQKPRQMIDALVAYYSGQNANIHRAAHSLASRATELYETTRQKLARFIGAPSPDEVIFTRNSTESLNLVAGSWGTANVHAGDEIIVTQAEHHSNLVPWQVLAQATGASIVVAPIDAHGLVDLDAYRALLSQRTKVVAITHMSNVLGTIAPVAEMSRLAHAVGAIVVVDGAQSAPHLPLSVQSLGCDFFALSAHKMLGPTGVGALWGRRELLDAMPPFLTGGSMIGHVDWDRSTWAPIPQKFEAGTPNIADVIAFGASIDYLEALGMESVRHHEQEITAYAIATLRERHPAITIYGTDDTSVRGGVVTFNIRNVHPHDISEILDERGIAIRAGQHCAHPLHKILGTGATARASFYLYNLNSEVDALSEGLAQVETVFRRVIDRPAR
jgi:cysteine desulfurase/selenocysteine lyase